MQIELIVILLERGVQSRENIVTISILISIYVESAYYIRTHTRT